MFLNHTLRLLFVTLCLSLVGAAQAADGDNDGVPDGTDVCCNTPLGTPVNAVGRPKADLDNDCDVDMTDFGIFQVSLTGPLTCSAEVCDGIDNDCNCIVDDVGSITCGTGACQVTVPACANGQPNVCVPGNSSPEVCDGIDNDCDGSVDENLNANAWYQDNDGDGYGNLQNQVFACAQPPGYASQPGDCDDQDPSISPSAAEICNGVDDDCDGTVDDNAVGGQTWYQDADGDGYGNIQVQVTACTAPPGYVLSGYDCDDSNPAVRPSAMEICNGVDDDCDGNVDDNLGTQTCGTGACQVTVPTCVNGQPNPCVPGNSSPEVCDGIDNDCNGMVDESLIGCAPNCPGNPQAEVCDGIDNDCDNQVDEGLGATTCGMGACQNTVQNCVNGSLQSCSPGLPSTEVCDGIDNDCDGMVDESNSCPTVPNAFATCSGTVCNYACNAGYADCNGSMIVDGCEIYITADPNNCGACGAMCPSRPNAVTTCANNACSFYCNAGYADCNGLIVDGCEASLNSNTNCGACNAVCPSGFSCSNGQCFMNNPN